MLGARAWLGSVLLLPRAGVGLAASRRYGHSLRLPAGSVEGLPGTGPQCLSGPPLHAWPFPHPTSSMLLRPGPGSKFLLPSPPLPSSFFPFPPLPFLPVQCQLPRDCSNTASRKPSLHPSAGCWVKGLSPIVPCVLSQPFIAAWTFHYLGQLALPTSRLNSLRPLIP